MVKGSEKTDMKFRDIKYNSKRWGVSMLTIDTWIKESNIQLALLKRGAAWRTDEKDNRSSPISSLSHFTQAQGVFIKDVVEYSGLTKQTLNRLAKRRNTHRVRDLIAGSAVLVAARNRAALIE